MRTLEEKTRKVHVRPRQLIIKLPFFVLALCYHSFDLTIENNLFSQMNYSTLFKKNSVYFSFTDSSQIAVKEESQNALIFLNCWDLSYVTLLHKNVWKLSKGFMI